MPTMMQVLGYFELIIYIYIVCNRVFIELHDRTACKVYLLRCIFSQCNLLSRCNLLSPTAREAENRRLKTKCGKSGSPIMHNFRLCGDY
jgi:hypothetical protein